MTADSSPRILSGIGGILFDFGGTLDGDGLHWLDRFYALYDSIGLQLPREKIRAAFDFAEAQASRDRGLREARLDEMVERHVGWQFEHLGIGDAKLQRNAVEQFVTAIRTAAARNVPILAALAQRGLRLGVISNGCGNTSVLCDELGYTPHLDLVLDSACVGLSKPDPEFYRYASAQLGIAPEQLLMVGDSLERDVKPAKHVRMRTAWITTAATSSSESDFVIASLPELLAFQKTKAGIFAGGQGSRLRSAAALKPLVTIGDRALIIHVLEGFAEARVGEVAILINEEASAVQAAVEQRDWPFELQWIVQTTPSSMESFLRVIEMLAADGSESALLLSTVDTIVDRREVADFFTRACASKSDVTLAVNVPTDDDNPLWVRCDANGANVTALGADAADAGLATAGLYCVRPTVLREAAAARSDKLSSLRIFLGRLLANGYSIRAERIANSVDVDRPADIIAAEKLVRQSVT